MLQKLTSRKFQVVITNIVIGMLMVFNFSEQTAVAVAGAVITLISSVAYIAVEGKIDAVRVASTIQVITDTIEDVKEELK